MDLVQTGYQDCQQFHRMVDRLIMVVVHGVQITETVLIGLVMYLIPKKHIILLTTETIVFHDGRIVHGYDL